MESVTCSRIRLAIVAALVAIGTIQGVSAAPLYEVINIGNLPGTSGGRAMAINNNNQVVGISAEGGTISSFQWSQATGMLHLNQWGFEQMVVNDINDNGMAVGAYKNNGVTKGYRQLSTPGSYFLWNVNPFGGYTINEVHGINNLGLMSGNNGAGNGERASTWTIFQGSEFGNLNEAQSTAMKINDAGVAVGRAELGGIHKAMIFRPGNNHQVLHSMLPGAVSSLARDINDSGWVVGSFDLPGNVSKAFVFSPELGMQVLTPNFAPPLAAHLFGISDSGIAVGISSTGINNHSSAIIWTPTGGLNDLNTMIDPNSGWVLRWATDVNDAGYIVGNGTYNGVQSNFMLRPVPEPSTMIGLGLGIATLVRRRKKRSVI